MGPRRRPGPRPPRQEDGGGHLRRWRAALACLLRRGDAGLRQHGRPPARRLPRGRDQAPGRARRRERLLPERQPGAAPRPDPPALVDRADRSTRTRSSTSTTSSTSSCARAAERRQLLEEAAQVRGVKQRRQEAGQRLTELAQNLLRLEDLRSEIEPRLEVVRAQAAAAREGAEAAARLELLRGSIVWEEWREARDAHRRATGQAQSLERQAGRGARAGQGAPRTSSRPARTEVQAAQDRRLGRQRKLGKLGLELAAAEHALQLAEERANGQRALAEAVRHEDADSRTKSAAAEALQAQLAEEFERRGPRSRRCPRRRRRRPPSTRPSCSRPGARPSTRGAPSPPPPRRWPACAPGASSSRSRSRGTPRWRRPRSRYRAPRRRSRSRWRRRTPRRRPRSRSDGCAPSWKGSTRCGRPARRAWSGWAR